MKGGADLAPHIPRAALKALATSKPEKLQLFRGGKIDVKDGFACVSADAAMQPTHIVRCMSTLFLSQSVVDALDPSDSFLLAIIPTALHKLS